MLSQQQVNRRCGARSALNGNGAIASLESLGGQWLGSADCVQQPFGLPPVLGFDDDDESDDLDLDEEYDDDDDDFFDDEDEDDEEYLDDEEDLEEIYLDDEDDDG